MRGQGRWQGVCFESLIEIVLPQKRFENVFLLIDFSLSDHGLSSLFLFLFLVPIDPYRLAGLRAVLITLSVASSVLEIPPGTLFVLLALDAEYAHHFVELGLVSIVFLLAVGADQGRIPKTLVRPLGFTCQLLVRLILHLVILHSQ